MRGEYTPIFSNDVHMDMGHCPAYLVQLEQNHCTFFLTNKKHPVTGGLSPSSASVQSLPRPMLNSTGVRYPLLFCSKLSKTVSSCSGVRGSSLWSRCKDKRRNKLEAQLKSFLWLSLPSSALAPSNVSFQHCILPVCQWS